MATQGKAGQGKAGEQARRRRKGVRVTDVTDFKPTKLSLTALQAMPNESLTGTIDCVERGGHFNKWRRQTEERLEVFFTDGRSVVLNDGMERTIIEAYGTDAGSWTSRQLTVCVEYSEHLNKKTGEFTRTAARTLRCHPVDAVTNEVKNDPTGIREAAFSDNPSD